MKRKEKKASGLIILFIAAQFIVTAIVNAVEYNDAPVLAAYLSGEQELPGVVTEAQGRMLFYLSNDGEELYFKLNLSQVKNISAVNIHMAQKGETGPVVVVLFDSDDIRAGRFNGSTAEGVITSDDLVGPLVGASLDKLLREMGEGYTYINVNTSEYPLGYIRGRIIDPYSFEG